ncbi:MAG: VCBS repeat-containing protein [Planctomycetes bacterium]|nr:VCBS repeat-containing protein [Planctomycetota bacterium]MBI3847202.1 VCBS repeat-containing protein [Planctomycetota bacterium]
MPRRAAAADLDGDGNVDIVLAADRTDNVVIFFGDGTGHFIANRTTYLRAGIGPIDAQITDLNRDGILDIVAVNVASYDVAVFFGGGAGTFQAAQFFGAGDNAYHLGIGDFNGDSKPDIIVVNKDEGRDLSVLLNRL